MVQSVLKKAVYEDLLRLPDNMVGQIIDGDLIALPRPSPRHAQATSALGFEIGPPYRFGRGGPGGWIILDEPEIRLGEDILVPDMAGWRRERLPSPPAENWISLAPDWVCEVLSPGTERIDRIRKMPIYAAFKVPHLWLVNPREKTLEVFKRSAGGWLLLAAHGGDETVRAEPFAEIGIDLGLLWWE